MFQSINLLRLLWSVLALLLLSSNHPLQAQHALKYKPAPVDNPLKGVVPYSDPKADRFPHSMEFSYIKFSDLVVGPDQYDWQPLEQLLQAVGSRGNQTVFRVYLEYPGHENVIPQFLIDGELKIVRWKDKDVTASKFVETPDYENAELRKSLQQFIIALGKKYDGDPRIGYITAGLLGVWGEWHNYPHDELWASKETQDLVLDAYESAFKKTPILLRYPAGDENQLYVSNRQRKFGYHDDSFAFATVDTGKAADDWFFGSLLKKADAMGKWKTQPIGGEIRPEVWGCCFDLDSCTPKGQGFGRCRDQTHVTWLMDSGLFENKASKKRLNNAKAQVRKMGYEFFVQDATTEVLDGKLKLKLSVKNTGMAPFYHDGWTIHCLMIDSRDDGGVKPIDTGLELNGILPNETKVLEVTLKANPWNPDSKILIGVPNPMPGGKPLRFANAKQDTDREGWLSIKN